MHGSSPTGIPQPARVRAARDLRGLTQLQTARAMPYPISTAALSQIESGKVRPSQSTLAGLAKALDVPQEFFFAPWPSAARDASSGVVHFRDLASSPARQRRKSAALALILSDLIAAIEQRVQLPELRLPQFDVLPTAGRCEIEDAAQALRGEWDLGDGPIPHVVRTIESNGVPIAGMSLGTRRVDAFAVAFRSRPVIILARDKSNYVRSRFDAAHELGHLAMHCLSPSPAGRQSERQAHDFAAAFLMPEHVAKDVLPSRVTSRTWADLADLKREWGMSMSALLYKSREVGVMLPDAYLNAIKYMSARGWRKREPGDKEMGQPETPRLLEHALRTIEVQTGEDRQQLAASAGLPRQDVAALLRTATDARPRVTA